MKFLRTRFLFLSLIMLLLSATTALAQEPQTLMPYLKGNLYGYANQKGKIIIKPKYDYVSLFEDGFARVRLNNKWGIIKQNGKSLIDPIAQNVSPFDKNGLAVLKIDGKSGVINTKGEWVVPSEYVWIEIKSGYIQVSNEERKAALLNIQGKILIDFEYDYFSLHEVSTESGSIVVQKNGKYGMVEVHGNTSQVKISPEYKSLNALGSDFFEAKSGEKKGLINSKGEVVAPFEFENFERNGDFIVAEREVSYEVKVKIIDSEGIYSHRRRDEIDKEFDKENRIVYYFFTQEEHDNLKAISKEYGYDGVRPDIIRMFSVINNEGEVVIPDQQGYIEIHKHFILARMDGRDFGNKITLFTKKGESVLSAFHAVHEVQEDLIAVRILSEPKEVDYRTDTRSQEEKMIDFYNRFKCGFIDSTGKWVLPPVYSGAYSFNQQRASVRKDNKWALINKKGEVLTEFKYDQLYVAGDNRYGFRQGKRWGLMDLDGKEIIPATYYAYKMAEYDMDNFGGFSEVSGLTFEDGKALTSKQLPGFGQAHTTMIDTNGVQLFPFKYKMIEEQVGGLFKVSVKNHDRDHDSYGLIDQAGNVLVPADRDYIYWLENEEVFVTTKNSFGKEYSYYDQSGQKVPSPYEALEQEGLREYKLLPNGYYSAKYLQFTVYFTPEGIPLFELEDE